MFAAQITPRALKRLRDEFPPGTRVELVEMSAPYDDLPPGMKGEVLVVDDGGGVEVRWEDGTTLPVLPGLDKIRRIP